MSKTHYEEKGSGESNTHRKLKAKNGKRLKRSKLHNEVVRMDGIA